MTARAAGESTPASSRSCRDLLASKHSRVRWGLVPYVQALLLARTLRDDLEEYPPFLWK